MSKRRTILLMIVAISLIGIALMVAQAAFATSDDTPDRDVTIVSWYPDGDIADTKGAARVFNITINQAADVRWLMNGIEVYNESGVNVSSYRNMSAAVGYWNVTVYVYNGNGSDTHTWLWTVSDTHNPIFIDGYVQYTEGDPSNISVTVTNLNTGYNVTARTADNQSYYQIRTSSAHIGSGDTIRFNASEGGMYSLRDYNVTDEDVKSGGFIQNFVGSKPDLILTNKSESWSEGPMASETFTVSYKVENRGDGVANESNTSIYVDGVLVAKDPVGVLAMGEDYENTVEGSFYRAYDKRNTTVRVCADGDDAVNESTMEDNNCLENELVYDGPLPNLYFYKHSVSTPDSKGQFTVYYYGVNQPTEANPGGWRCCACPTNTTISITNVSVNGSATDITVRDPVRGICRCGGDGSTLGPFTCSPGKEVRVNISLDGDHEVLEGNEIDNNWTKTFLCPGAKPDLKITEHKEQGISEANKTFNLTYTVENIGLTTANNSTTRIVNTGLACTQEIFDSVPALAPGENYTSTVGPLRLCGDKHVHYVFSTKISITTDYDGVVDEANEGNNYSVRRPGLPYIQILNGDIRWIDGVNKTFYISGFNVANPPDLSGAALNWSKLRIYLDGNLSWEQDVRPIPIGKFYSGGRTEPLTMPEGKDNVTIRSCIEWVSEWDGSNSSSCVTTTFGGGACIGDDGYIVTCGTSITGYFGEPPTISKSCTLTGDMYCPGGIYIAGSDIVIDGNGSEIFGWGDRYSWGSNSHTLSVYINSGCDNVTIKNMDIRNHITGICIDDIDNLGDTNNITIENCSVLDNIRYGIFLSDSWLTFLHNNTVCGNDYTDITDTGSMSATFGDENTCDTVKNYNDEATIGCTYHCDGANGVCIGETRNFTCGDVVTESCTFDRAISCPPGDGLIAGADGIVIDGARYKLIGNYTGAGIISNHADVVVRNLQVTDFSTGIRVEGTNNTIESCTLRKNAQTGINLSADNCTVRDTRIYDNLGSGIVVFGNNSTFTNNTAARNPGYGFYFSPHTVDNTIIANFIGDNEGVDINATTANLTGYENTCDATDSYWDASMRDKLYGCVYPWTPPDLTITKLEPKEVRTDEEARYDTRYTIENIGDPNSRRVKSMSWLYIDHQHPSDATDRVELLGPGAANTRNFGYPVTITRGNDTVIKVCADGPDEIRETNEVDKFYCNMVGCYTVPDLFKCDEEMNNCMTDIFSEDGVGEGLEGGVCVCADGGCEGVDRGYYIYGDEVKESCTFNGSMECPSGHGLEIHGSGITIDGADYELNGLGNATRTDYDEGTPGAVDCGIYIAGGGGNTVKNLRITGFCTGIGVLGAAENTIDNCDIYDNGMGRGIHLAEVTGSTILNTKVHGNSNGGIYLGQSSNDNTIESTSVCENGGDGIHTAGITTIKDNTVCQNGGTDIVAENEQTRGDENTCYTTEDYNDDGAVRCTHPCDNPDLTVTENSADWVSDPPDDRVYTITYTIANVGCKDALAACNVHVCVDDDGVGNEYPVPVLGKGESHTNTIGDFKLSGVEDVINVTVDPDGEIDEMNEGNNSLENPWYALPDLTITTFDVPRNLKLFNDSTANVTIANIGTIAAGAFDVTLYVNDKEEETFQVGRLDAGKDVYLPFDWFVLASNKLVVVADSKNEIVERDETNNTVTEVRSLSGGPPGEPGDNTPHIHDPDGLPEDPDPGIDLAEMARIESMDYDMDDVGNGSASGRVSKERVSAQLFKSVPFLSDASDIVVSHTGLIAMGALFIATLFLIGYRGEIMVHRRNGR